MKTYLFIIISLLISGHSYSQAISISTDTKNARISFGIKKIREAASGKKWQIIEPSSMLQINGILFSVQIISDSAKSSEIIRSNKWKPVVSMDAQCYAIRINKKEDNETIYILSGESTGAMYGALDIAEAIECNSINQLKESDNTPYLKKRGIKFNIPLDLRTPSYSDPGDAHQQNIGDVWSLDFWQTYFDEMAIHRYN
ncbi:MAG: hypothetical protein JJE22_11750, partial [Bacteroidia bacterium]|nr:hypothetical protein [Bacteroidia bacterium]